MMLMRSSNGFKNMHHFYDVDCVVYLEGGGSLTQKDVLNGKYNSTTCDIRYWNKVFDLYAPKDKKFKFKSIGSKTLVKEISEKVKSGDKVFFVMDSDYELLHGIKVPDNVIYSYGYSWENDLISHSLITDVVLTMTGLDNTQEAKISGEVTELLDNFLSGIRRAIYIDCYAVKNGYKLIDRKKYLRYIKIVKKRPILNKIQVLSSLKDLKESIGEPIVFEPKLTLLSNKNACFGHLLFDFCHKVVTYLIKKYANLPIPQKQTVSALMVTNISNKESLEESVNSYYEREFEKVA